MTIVTDGDEEIIEQITKQLHKLIPVITVDSLAETSIVEREMMFLKIGAEDAKRSEILRIAEIFRCKVVDVSLTELTLEAVGDQEKLDAVIKLLQRFGIREMTRTGTMAMRRSMQ
jgi:acetolactate synthase-1/3 small subunit